MRDEGDIPGDAARIEDVLRDEGAYVGPVQGTSMRPMLREGRDVVVVEPARGPLHVHDVALYRRGDRCVLHRVIAVHEGTYDILGDNCLNVERGIPHERVIGVLTGFFRDERRVDMDGAVYRAYVRAWCSLSSLRRLLMRARRAVGHVRDVPDRGKA